MAKKCTNYGRLNFLLQIVASWSSYFLCKSFVESSQNEDGGAKHQCLMWKSEDMDTAIELVNSQKCPTFLCLKKIESKAVSDNNSLGIPCRQTIFRMNSLHSIANLLSQQPRWLEYCKQPCEDLLRDPCECQAELGDIARIAEVSFVSSLSLSCKGGAIIGSV